MKRLALMAALLMIAACKGSDSGETGPAHTDEMWCGDVDGAGHETGDVPNILGDWTSSVAFNYFEEDCGLPNLDDHSIGFMNGTMSVEGFAPDGLVVVFNDDRRGRLRAIMAPTGGLTITGRRDTTWGMLYLAVGGLVFDDVYLKDANAQGMVYAGVDEDGDEIVDCNVWADFRAFRGD